MKRAAPRRKSPSLQGGGRWHGHKKVAREAALRLLAKPIASTMTVIVIATALLLPALILGLYANMEAVLDRFRQQVELNLYLDLSLGEGEARKVSEDLLLWEDIESLVFVPADEALAKFARGLGFPALAEELETNPLPATLIIQPRTRQPGQLQDLAGRLKRVPGVAEVQLDSQWLQRLGAIAALLRRAGLILAGIMALGLLLIVANTIKLEVENRREQIRVYKLVGASDGFVARPFLYTGLYYGLAGGVLAALLQALVPILLGPEIRALGLLYGSEFDLPGLGPPGLLLVVSAGAFTGWLAAVLASVRQILTIE